MQFHQLLSYCVLGVCWVSFFVLIHGRAACRAGHQHKQGRFKMMKTSNAEEHEARDKVLVPLMEEILHQLILVGRLSHYLQGFIHPRWCRISSINSKYVMAHDCWQIAYWKSGFSKTCAADCRRKLVTRQQKGRSRLVRQSNLPDRCQQQRFEN